MHGMVNPHIVVGEHRRCICGNYHGKDITCADVLADIKILKESHFGDLRECAERVESVIKSLLVECVEPYAQEAGDV